MKNKVIKICIILGAVSIMLIIFGVLVLLLTSWCIKSLLFDLCLAIGSGLLCSVIVSFLIEKSNSKLINESRRNQRKFILNAFETGVEYLLQMEYNALQNFSLLKDMQKCVKQEKKEDSIKDLTIKIQDLLKYINDNILDYHKIFTYNPTCNSFSVAQKYAYGESVFNYKVMYKVIENILSEGGAYLVSNVLSKEQIEQLQRLSIQIDDVILYSTGENYAALFSQKQIFFDLLLPSLDILQLDSNKKIAYLNLTVDNA